MFYGLWMGRAEFSAADLKSGTNRLMCKQQELYRDALMRDVGTERDALGDRSYEEYTERLVQSLPQRLPLGKIFGALLYISSRNADIETVYEPPALRIGKKSRNLAESTVHDVGFKIKDELEDIQQAQRRTLSQAHNPESRAGAGTGRQVSTHVRRGHFHCYWLGPRDNPTDIAVHWLAPTIVHGKGPVQGVIHNLECEQDQPTAAQIGKLEALREAGAVTQEEIDSLANESSATALLAVALNRPVNAPDGFQPDEAPVQEAVFADPAALEPDAARE